MSSAHRVLAAIRGTRPSVSFEFFPPRDASAEAKLVQHVAAATEVRPDFVSVTYGAGGSSRNRMDGSVRLTRAIDGIGGPAVMAHLTLVGHTRGELDGIVQALAQAGADAMLALRGDPPGGPLAPWVATPDGYDHAVDLVRVMRRGAHDVGVAAFPHGHPASTGPAQDMAALAEKEQAGAAFAITQMVFDAPPYVELVARARAAGIGLPILPGIMPVGAAASVERLEAFSGAPLPSELLKRLDDAATNQAARAAVGIDWAVEIGAKLLEAGAPGLHFYTLNRSDTAAEVCRRLDLTGRPEQGD
ncbi:MAG: methylenetetrahydrofolate reductase [Bifidobacteriaceae bacterium]|jgi:methylenetetrahydrofolate reductase (NADPH)|nr:methylenetetrahydrofolate reductase [Bifidobacteriaceae bacterium]